MTMRARPSWVAGDRGLVAVLTLLLLLVNGFGQIGAAVLAMIRHPLSPWLMGILGVGLLIWITVQVLVVPLSFLQPAIFLLGLLQGFVALLWLRRLGSLRTGDRPGTSG